MLDAKAQELAGMQQQVEQGKSELAGKARFDPRGHAAGADGKTTAEAEVKTARDQLTNELQKKNSTSCVETMELDQREAEHAPASSWRLSSARPLRWRPDNQRNSAMGPRRTSKNLWIPATSYADCVGGLTVPGRRTAQKRMRASSWRPDKTCAGAMMAQPRQQPSACF